MSTTAKPTQPTSIFHESYRGYRVYRWFRSANGSNRLCGTQQGWMVEHDAVSERWALATGWTESLRRAKAEIDKLYALAHDASKLDELVEWARMDRLEMLARVFPGAPNPPIAHKRLAEQRDAAQAKHDEEAAAAEKAKKVADAAPDMLAALIALLAHEGEVEYSGIGTEHDTAALEAAKEAARAAIAKATA